MNGWYIKNNGVKHELIMDCNILLNESDINELVLPSGARNVYCWRNNLTELIIPDGLEQIDCSSNQLTELIVPDSVMWIHCYDNNLTELIVPDNCKVNCDPNVMIITKTMINRSNRLKNLLK
jgi:hypothetical protein